MESNKENTDIIPTSDYKYFLTNDIEMTYDDYIHLLTNSQNNIDIESKIMIVYVKNKNYKIIFAESKMNSIKYLNAQSEIVIPEHLEIEITEELEKRLFEYLDSLNWNTQESMTDLEREQIGYIRTINNSLLIYASRICKSSEYNRLQFQKDKNNIVSYRLDLDSGYAFLSNPIFSSNDRDLYAKLDAFELAQILYKSNINVINKINNISYINPNITSKLDCKTLSLQSTNEFIYYEGATYSTFVHGKYYIIGNKLILLYKYPVGAQTITYVEEYVIYEIEENKLIYKEGIVKTVFGKGLMGDLEKLIR